MFSGVDDETLLSRMRAGDRDAAAEYLLRRREALRRWTDRAAGPRGGEDLLSTVLRRFDRLVHAGRFQGRTEADAWRVVVAIGRRTLVNLTQRAALHRKAIEALGATRANATSDGDAASASFDAAALHRIVAGLGNEDYLVLVGKLEGRRSHEIAASFGASEEAVRTRWSRLRKMLIEQIAA